MLLIAMCGCAHVDKVAIGTSTATLACDWATTRDAAGAGWRTTYEENPLLGEAPPKAAVDVYFASAIAAQLAAAYFAPRWARIAGAVAIVAIETKAIAHNVQSVGACGF